MEILPHFGQDWSSFAITLPGTSGSTGNQGRINPGKFVTANGNLPYNNVLSDGASTSLGTSGNSDLNVYETVQEVQVSTSAFPRSTALAASSSTRSAKVVRASSMVRLTSTSRVANSTPTPISSMEE